MTTTRLLRTTKPSGHVISSSTCSSSSAKTVRCLRKAEFNGETRVCGNCDQKKSAAPIKASVVTSKILMISTKPKVDRGIDLGSILENVTDALFKLLRSVAKPRPWKFQIQMFMERAIIDCRFFTFFAVAGSVLGSILCFVEGCFLLLGSYFQFFKTLSQKAGQAHIMHTLIEAIDMFLVGTALLTFGVGLYVMFVGSENIREKAPQLPGSNLFGLFHLKTLPKWVEMESVSKAKSKIGHAVLMILQVGVLEKFNSIPLVTSVDLVCFAGAVLVSSACIFLLSRLSVGRTTQDW